jgi:hypothetical protein
MSGQSPSGSGVSSGVRPAKLQNVIAGECCPQSFAVLQA